MAGAKANSAMLTGCRVLDFTQYLCREPTVTRLMARDGAPSIIKGRAGADGRSVASALPTVKTRAQRLFRAAESGARRACALISTNPNQLEILRALVAKVDIVVENFGPGVMQKRGLDYDSLKLINPRLIMASLSAFGRKSPLAHKTGYDMIAQAFSGMMHMTGDPDGSPTFVRIGVAGTSEHRSTYFCRTRICTV